MRRVAWSAVLAAQFLAVLAAQCPSGVARAKTPTSTNPDVAKTPALELSVEVRRCLRVGQLPAPDSEDRQLQCLASQDESGFVELVRSIAKRRRESPGFGAERLEHMSWKVRQALSKGRQEAAVAVETMLDDEASPDIELETTALEAMRWVTIARRSAELPRGQRTGATRPLAEAPRACAERVNAAEPRVAQRAVACVAEAEANIPVERLIDGVLKQPERVEIWRLLKRLRKLSDPHARRLAEALVAKRNNDDGRADDFCETLLHGTSVDAVWATLAGRRTFDLFGVRECEGLARRTSKPASASPPEPTPAQGPSRPHCLDVPTAGHDYATICASRQGALEVRPSRFGRSHEGQVRTTHAWLLEGERLLVDELGYVPLAEPPQKVQRPERWQEGLAIVPSSNEAGRQRRLHVFGVRNMRLSPLWQSPECGHAGCRLDLVARRKVERGELLELLLLTERQARPVALVDLLDGTLDDRLGCSRLRPLALSDCARVVAR